MLNAADEVAVAAFLDGRIPFTAIAEVVERTLEAMPARAGRPLRGPLRRPTRRRARAPASWSQGAGARVSWVLAFAGFAVLIILHEAGHFVAAKATGMRVERFFLFFPPKLVSVKRGETEYGIGAIPLGGFVKITGMNPDEELPPEVAHRGYYNQPVWKRIVVIAAGPAVNIVIAFVILFALFAFNDLAEPTSIVGAVEPGSPAAGGARSRATDRLGRRRQHADRPRTALSAPSRSTATSAPASRRHGCRAATPGAGRGRARRAERTTLQITARLRRRGRAQPARLPVPRPSAVDLGPAGGRRALGRLDVVRHHARPSSVIAQIFDPEQREQVSGVVGSYEVDPAGDRLRRPARRCSCSR